MVTYEERQEYQYHLEKKLFKSARKRGHNNLKSIGCQLSTRHVYMCVSMYIIWLYIYFNPLSRAQDWVWYVYIYYIIIIYYLLFIHVFIYLFIYLFIVLYLFIYLFTYLFIYYVLYVYLLLICKPASLLAPPVAKVCDRVLKLSHRSFRLSPTLLSGPHSTCFCHVPEHGTPQVESIWEWIWPTHRIFETKWNKDKWFMWQCVKTNSTPFVHIKIAGIYGCSSPFINGINRYWSIPKWFMSVSVFFFNFHGHIRTVLIILVPNTDKSENQKCLIKGKIYLHQVPRRWGNKSRQTRTTCHWQWMSTCHHVYTASSYHPSLSEAPLSQIRGYW